MHTQIRLANNQGHLRGKDLSPVQVNAVLLLDRIEQYEHNRQQNEGYRRDIALIGWQRWTELFPEYVPESAQVSSQEEIDRALAEDSETGETDAVIFDFSGAYQMLPEEIEEHLAGMLQGSPMGSVNAQVAEDNGWF